MYYGINFSGGEFMKHQYLLASLLIVGATYGHSRDHYIESYSVDPEIAAILDLHSEEISKKLQKIYASRWQKHGVWQFDWLPGYYVKYGLSRIDGMERMKKCIKDYNLDLLTVPDKKIYHLKGRPHELSDLNYAVIIKAVDASPNHKPLTLKQVKQLCTIIHKTDYISMTSTNYIRTTDGKLSLIDTEATYDRKKLLKGFLRMVGTDHNLNRDYEKESLKHVFSEIKKYLAKHPKEADSAMTQLLEFLKEQKKPHSWDYTSFFKSYFKHYL
jgi:hypothetical protein